MKSIIRIGISLLLITSSILVIMTLQVDAKTITVDDDGGADYEMIQDAINISEDGDTIRVFEGTYYENVAVNREVILIGNGSANTTIDGGGSGDVVKITADWVNMSGFRVTGSGSDTLSGMRVGSNYNHIFDNNCSDNNYGIYLSSSSHCKIRNNTCWSNIKRGIYLSPSSHCTITYNTCLNNERGIYLRTSSYDCTIIYNSCLNNERGISLSSSDDCTISFNTCLNNEEGIRLDGSDDCTITNNSCSNNEEGIRLDGSDDCTITNNTCLNNEKGIFLSLKNCIINNNTCSNNEYGIFLHNSINNTITSNTISENIIGIYLEVSSWDNNACYNNIYNNTNYAINVNDNNDYTIIATYNWWGDPSGPYKPTENPNGKGDNVTDYVEFVPWCSQELKWETLYVAKYGNDTTGNGTKDDPFLTIQKAIDELNHGDTIRVFEGVYKENVVVNRSVDIIGNGSRETVIQGDGPEVTEIGSFDTAGSATGLTVRGDFVYISDRENGLVIVNISDPRNPTLAGHLESHEASFDIEVYGNYAYVADSGNGLIIANVSDSTNPEQVGWYDTDGSSRGLAVRGDYAFIADGNNDLVIVDITNKSNPIFVGHCDTSGIARNVVVDGDFAYVAASNGGLIIVNITDRQNPVFEGQFATSGSAEDVAVRENLAFVADNNNGLVIIDVTDPSTPVLVGHHITESAFGVTLWDNYAFIADGSDGVEVVDIMDPAHPMHVVSYRMDDWALDVVVQGNRAYIANHDYGLSILEYDVPPGITLQLAADSIDISGLTVCNSSDAAIIVDGDSIEIDGCQITDNNDGIRIINGSKHIEIHSCDIYENERYGINASDNDNRITFLLNNWWGDTSGPYHPTLNSDGKGNAVTDYVVFDPWLTRPKDFKEHHVSPDGSDTTGTGEEGNPYQTIQKAIDKAQDWDTIVIAPGTYLNTINVIKRNLTIIGESPENTIIDCGEDGVATACTITADNVELNGFTIKNGNENGILIINSSGNRIVNCVFPDNSYDLNLTNSLNNLLINTTFDSVFFSDPESSISVLWSVDLKVTDNRSGVIPNAHLKIRDIHNTIVFDGYTDGRGMVPQMILLDYGQNQSSTIDLNPYTISIWKGGHLNFHEELSVTSYTHVTFQLETHILPIAVISGDLIRHVDMDSTIQFDGTGSTGRSLTYFWDLGDAIYRYIPIPSHTYTVPGVYQIDLTVTDDYQNTSTTSIIVVVANVIPMARVEADVDSVFEDDTIEFIGWDSWDTSSDKLTYLWDFGDGAGSAEMAPVHTYQKQGHYEVYLTVTDKYGGESSTVLPITVTNVEPQIIETNVTGLRHPGKPIQCAVTADDTSGDAPGLLYSWDFGDGNSAFGKNVTYSYARAGMYTMQVTVKDDDGATDSKQIQINITDPMIDVSVSSNEVFQDDMVYFQATHELDNGSFTYMWYFGDGTSEMGTDLSHIFTMSGTYAPWLIIFDGVENITIFLLEITVYNVIPIPAINVDKLVVIEDDKITFNASETVDSASDQSILTYVWDFGDNSNGVGIEVSHLYSTQGIYQATLTVSDGKVTNTSQMEINVLNVCPRANAGSEKYRRAAVKTPIILDASASSGTFSEIPFLNYTWKIENETLYGKVVSYTFTSPGSSSVTLQVTDDDGCISEDTIVFLITKAPESEDEETMNVLSMLLVAVIIVLFVILILLIGRGSGNGSMVLHEGHEDAIVVEDEEDEMIEEGKIDDETFKPPRVSDFDGREPVEEESEVTPSSEQEKTAEVVEETNDVHSEQ